MRLTGFWPPRHSLFVGLSTAVCLTAGLASPQTGGPAGGTPPSSGIQLEGYIRAIQGDTLDAGNARGRIGIGIIGVKVPGGNTPCGKQATAFTQDFVSDGVQLTEEPGLTLDARKRRMYHVTAPDGRSLAEELVASGFARADGQGANRDRLAELEAAAREARRGCLWGAAK